MCHCAKTCAGFAKLDGAVSAHTFKPNPHVMEHSFASATILLLLITDPLGNIPIFVNSLKAVPAERRSRVIVREVLIAFAVLLAFMFAGQAFLQAMSLSGVSLQIGGALVLFLIALRMIFAPPTPDSPVPSHEPLIVPLAIPALAGPSALATVLLLVSQAPERRLEWVAALTVTMLVCAVVLLLAERLQKRVGERVISAFERLMGLILVSIAVEMMLRGIKELARTWPN
jgi:MarC family membrane protein